MALWPVSTLHNCDALPPSTGWATIQSTMTLQCKSVTSDRESAPLLVLCPCPAAASSGGWEEERIVDIYQDKCRHLSRHRTPDTALQRLAASWSIKCCRLISDISSVDQCRPLQQPAHHGEKLHHITCSFMQQNEFDVWCCSSCHTMHVV